MIKRRQRECNGLVFFEQVDAWLGVHAANVMQRRVKFTDEIRCECWVSLGIHGEQ